MLLFRSGLAQSHNELLKLILELFGRGFYESGTLFKDAWSY